MMQHGVRRSSNERLGRLGRAFIALGLGSLIFAAGYSLGDTESPKVSLTVVCSEYPAVTVSSLEGTAAEMGQVAVYCANN